MTPRTMIRRGWWRTPEFFSSTRAAVLLVEQVLGAPNDVLHMTHIRHSIPAQRGNYVENPLRSWCLFAKRCTVPELRNDAVTDGASDDGTSLFAVTVTSRGRHVERLCLVQKLGAYTQGWWNHRFHSSYVQTLRAERLHNTCVRTVTPS